MPSRRPAIAAAVMLAACGCHGPNHAAGTSAASATPAFDRLCSTVHGIWEAGAGHCKLSRDAPNGAHLEVTASYPVDLVDTAPSGPVLSSFVEKFFADYGHMDSDGNGRANLTSQVHTHASTTKSVVFQSDWYFSSMPHPDAAIATFTFDSSRQLQLNDLLCPGLDARKAIPPIAHPVVQQALSGSPFQIERFEPDHAEGDLADDYQAWALDGDALVLYMPAERGPGGVSPGFISPHIPLSQLAPILRSKGCPT
jgi:hypothetical protein